MRYVASSIFRGDGIVKKLLCRIQNIRAVKTGENRANLKFDKCHVFAWAFTMPPSSIKMALLVVCFMSLKLLEIEIIEVKIEWN